MTNRIIFSAFLSLFVFLSLSFAKPRKKLPQHTNTTQDQEDFFASYARMINPIPPFDYSLIKDDSSIKRSIPDKEDLLQKSAVRTSLKDHGD